MTAKPILRQCLDKAVTAAGPLIGRCLEQAITSLQEAENKSGKMAERHEIADAWRDLLRVGSEWAQRYPRELKIAIDARRDPAAAAAPAEPAKPKMAALSLVDDDAVVQNIESSRLTQLLLPVVEQPLGELDGLMSTALGLPAVRPELNPLQPDVFAKAMQVLMNESGAQPSSIALWARHFSAPLGRELAQLYRDLVQLLKSADVRAATYRVLPVASAPAKPKPVPATGTGGGGSGGFGGPGSAEGFAAAGSGSGGGGFGSGGGGGSGGNGAGTGGGGGGYGGGGSPDAADGTGQGGNGAAAGPWTASNDARMSSPSAWADLSSYQLSDPLMQDFLFHGGNHIQAPLAPAYYDRVGEELASLEAEVDDPADVFDALVARQHEHLPAVDRPQRHVGIDSPLDEEVWGAYGAPRQRAMVRTRLKKQAQRVGQVLGLEVVKKLVDQVAQDPRLLAPVRESIVALEPSLLRMALVDPRFFSDENHPGRRLIERVAERSFKYNDEFSQEFQDFSDSVASVFNGLNGQEEVADAEPFRAALDKMEASWEAQDSHESEQRDKVLDAVRFAEQRQTEADQIAWDLSQRTDLENVPPVVQDFLFGPWALVMANARLTDNRRQIDPGGHGSVVTNLLWSVKREQTLREPVKLIEMIPGMLDHLRSGLAELGQDPAESEPFFRALEKLHRPVLRLRAKHRKDNLESAAMELEAETDEALVPAARRKPKAGNQFWMGRNELDAAGFEDTLPSAHAELIDLRERGAALAAAKAAQAEATASENAALEATAAAEVSASVNAEQVIASLREDCWVDLFSKGQWLRARLIWASSKGTLFMFVSHGGQPHSMTKRSCEKLIRERLLRLVDTHGVVEQALDSMKAERPSQRQALAA